MLRFIGGVIGLVIMLGGAVFAFAATREFVRKRLRFVDGVDNPLVPWVVAIVGVIAAGILAAILPFVGALTALVVGSAAGLGTASGVKALKRGE